MLRKRSYSNWLIMLAVGLGIGLAGCKKKEVVPAIIVTASAGDDQVIDLGEKVSIQGSGSASDGGSLTMVWKLTAVPAGSNFNGFESSGTLLEFVPDVAGSYTALLTATHTATGTAATDEALIEVNAASGPVEIYGTISADSTLANIVADANMPDYYVSKSDLVVDANLTVEPGVMIIFASDKGIRVTVNGAMNATGTASDSVIFTGEQETTGYWAGLDFQSNNTGNTLSYCRVSYGGSSGFDGANLKANVMVEDAGRLVMTNTLLRNSADYGLYVRNLNSALVGFANNVITRNNMPANALINHYQYFDSNSDYTGNTKDFIDADWSNTETSQDVTWRALNVPYRLAPNIEKISSAITIEPGAEFIGQSGSGIWITANGSLNAVGTANEMIVFRGEQDIKGYWRGLRFESNNTMNELTYVSIANGGEQGFDGANLKTNIMVEDAGRLVMTNSISKNAQGYGLYTRDLESTLSGFANNTLTGNDYPVMTHLNHYHYFDSSSDYSGNSKDYIDSYWSNSTTTIDATWQALNVPYRLADNREEIGSAIVVEAGAVFLGQPGSGITISGSLQAQGTSNNMIVFKGEQDVTGYWRGLRYTSNNTANTMDFVSIANGGEKGFDGGNRKANIEVSASGIFTITNSAINKSGGYGIGVQAGGSLTESGNTFSGNTQGDIINY